MSTHELPGEASASRSLIDLRRRLHQCPEVGLDLPQTQRLLLAEFEGLPVEVVLGRELSSIAVVVRGQCPGPTVLIRSDMDALPVAEPADAPFASSNGAMHACGHDLHMAAVTGAVRALCERREQLHGTVLAIFQPGEEGHLGAQRMIREGVLRLTGEFPIASYGLHVFSFLPAGTFVVRTGAAMAAAMNVDLVVVGTGGHAAHPQDAANPIPVATLIAQAIPNFVVQRNRADAPVVAVVGAFQAGDAANVIPDTVRLGISLRAISKDEVSRRYDELVALAAAIAEGHGMTVRADSGVVIPPVVNTSRDVDLARGVITDLFGTERLTDLSQPEMIAEDFSEFLGHTGGAFAFVGAGGAGDQVAACNHAPQVRFDESVIQDAADYLAELAIRRLAISETTA